MSARSRCRRLDIFALFIDGVLFALRKLFPEVVPSISLLANLLVAIGLSQNTDKSDALAQEGRLPSSAEATILEKTKVRSFSQNGMVVVDFYIRIRTPYLSKRRWLLPMKTAFMESVRSRRSYLVCISHAPCERANNAPLWMLEHILNLPETGEEDLFFKINCLAEQS